jgi:hypothetical protein
VAGSPEPVPQSKVLLSIFDLNALPAVQKLGEVEAAVSGFGLNDLKATWPKADLLVFSGGGGFNWWWPCLSCPIPLAADARLVGPWFPSGGGGRLLAFDVGDSSAPKFTAEVDMGTNGWWNFSDPFSTDGLVYLSHQLSEYYEVPVKDAAEVSPDGAIIGIPVPIGRWVTRSFLDVVDFADAESPVVRQPVNIPGRLTGISHAGSVLYTVGTHWSSNSANPWLDYLDASAFDGVAAHLVDSLPLPASWPHPVLVSRTNVFIGWPNEVVENGAAGQTNAPALQTVYLSNDGKLTRAGRAELKIAVTTLAAFGDLLAGQQTDNSVRLFDASAGGAVRTVGEGRPSGCQWYDLTRGDGALGRGLWLPLGAYGVAMVPAMR